MINTDGFVQKIKATDDHPFYVIGKGWRDTIELVEGDKVETKEAGSVTVVSIKDEQRTDVTYNFTIEDFHTYYVTKQNLLVHNCDLRMKEGGLGLSTDGKYKIVEGTVQKIIDSGKKADMECALCKLQTSVATRDKDLAKNMYRRNQTYIDHKKRSSMEKQFINTLETKLKIK